MVVKAWEHTEGLEFGGAEADRRMNKLNQVKAALRDTQLFFSAAL